MRVNFSDPLQLNRASVLAGGYARRLERRGQRRAVPSRRRVPAVRLARARCPGTGRDFYDLFGPTKTSRKGYYLEVGHKQTLVFDEPRRLDLDLEGSISGNLDQLPDYQNVPVDVDRLLALRREAQLLAHPQLARKCGRRDRDSGGRSSAEVDDVDGTTVPIAYGTFDRGWAMPAGSLVNLARATPPDSRPASSTRRSRTSSSAGSATTTSTTSDEKRYREYYSFPGAVAERDSAGATSSSPRSSGTCRRCASAASARLGFYAAWVRPAVFVGGPRRPTWTCPTRVRPRPTSADSSTCASVCCRSST